MKAITETASIKTKRAIALLERRAKRARRNGLPPVPDHLPEEETEHYRTRMALVAAGLHAPYGEPPRLVVRYSYASCPEDVEEAHVWADDLGFGEGIWTTSFVLNNARDLARLWLAGRDRRMFLSAMAGTAREINRGWTPPGAAAAAIAQTAERGAA